MKQYFRQDAKASARTYMQGIWAAALIPFADDLTIDEQAFRRNLRHWIDDFGTDGIFVGGKHSEVFSMSVREAFRRTRPAEDPHSLQVLARTAWADTRTRALTDARIDWRRKKEATQRAFAACGRRAGAPHKASAAQ
jgi:hypothetical protein